MKQWHSMHINNVTPANTCEFITMFTWASHLSISWLAWIKFTTSTTVSSRSIFVVLPSTCKSSQCFFLQASSSKPSMHFWSVTYPPILCFLVWLSKEHLMRSTHYEAPHLCNFLNLSPTFFLIAKRTSSASYSETPSACVLPLTWDIKCHVNIQYTAVIC